MTLRLYSALGREIRDFRPVTPGRASMYVCGVTPYDVTHLGHAFSYVQFDTLRPGVYPSERTRSTIERTETTRGSSSSACQR